ncbi:hypothetical protein HanRHA438_Chr02g0063341 [Helianthus annuus]|nr:hypothetical protein HanRHA438_Chr02g0063341 [Helianthus annuus]
MALEDLEPQLSRFTGSDPNSWISQSELYFRFYSIYGDERFSYVIEVFEDEPFYWFNSWFRSDDLTWKDFTTAMLHRFRSSSLKPTVDTVVNLSPPFSALKVFDEMHDSMEHGIASEVNNIIDDEVMESQTESLVDVNESRGVKDAHLDIWDYIFVLDNVTPKMNLVLSEYSKEDGITDLIACDVDYSIDLMVIHSFAWNPGLSPNHVQASCTPTTTTTVCARHGVIGNFAIFLVGAGSHFEVDWLGKTFGFDPGPYFINAPSTTCIIHMLDHVGATLFAQFYFYRDIVMLKPNLKGYGVICSLLRGAHSCLFDTNSLVVPNFEWKPGWLYHNNQLTTWHSLTVAMVKQLGSRVDNNQLVFCLDSQFKANKNTNTTTVLFHFQMVDKRLSWKGGTSLAFTVVSEIDVFISPWIPSSHVTSAMSFSLHRHLALSTTLEMQPTSQHGVHKLEDWTAEALADLIFDTKATLDVHLLSYICYGDAESTNLLSKFKQLQHVGTTWADHIAATSIVVLRFLTRVKCHGWNGGTIARITYINDDCSNSDVRLRLYKLVQVFLFRTPLVMVYLVGLMIATKKFSNMTVIIATTSRTTYKATLVAGSTLAIRRLNTCKVHERLRWKGGTTKVFRYYAEKSSSNGAPFGDHSAISLQQATFGYENLACGNLYPIHAGGRGLGCGNLRIVDQLVDRVVISHGARLYHILFCITVTKFYLLEECTGFGITVMMILGDSKSTTMTDSICLGTVFFHSTKILVLKRFELQLMTRRSIMYINEHSCFKLGLVYVWLENVVGAPEASDGNGYTFDFAMMLQPKMLPNAVILVLNGATWGPNGVLVSDSKAFELFPDVHFIFIGLVGCIRLKFWEIMHVPHPFVTLSSRWNNNGRLLVGHVDSGSLILTDEYKVRLVDFKFPRLLTNTSGQPNDISFAQVDTYGFGVVLMVLATKEGFIGYLIIWYRSHRLERATQEDKSRSTKLHPNFHLEDKVNLKRGSNVMNRLDHHGPSLAAHSISPLREQVCGNVKEGYKPKILRDRA